MNIDRKAESPRARNRIAVAIQIRRVYDRYIFVAGRRRAVCRGRCDVCNGNDPVIHFVDHKRRVPADCAGSVEDDAARNDVGRIGCARRATLDIAVARCDSHIPAAAFNTTRREIARILKDDDIALV